MFPVTKQLKAPLKKKQYEWLVEKHKRACMLSHISAGWESEYRTLSRMEQIANYEDRFREHKEFLKQGILPKERPPPKHKITALNTDVRFVYGIFEGDKCVYVGQSFDPEARFTLHLSSARNFNVDKPNTQVIAEYMHFVGIDKFTMKIFIQTDTIDVDDDEIKYIKMYDPICNVTNGGNSSRLRERWRF